MSDTQKTLDEIIDEHSIAKHLTVTGQSLEAEAYQSYKFGFTLGATGRPIVAAIDYPVPPNHDEANRGHADGSKVFREHMRIAWERLGKPIIGSGT